jgi:hypothetical protein
MEVLGPCMVSDLDKDGAPLGMTVVSVDKEK